MSDLRAAPEGATGEPPALATGNIFGTDAGNRYGSAMRSRKTLAAIYIHP